MREKIGKMTNKISGASNNCRNDVCSVARCDVEYKNHSIVIAVSETKTTGSV